jgi:GTP cyclohydrolase I/GTP cyclohydrolase-4
MTACPCAQQLVAGAARKRLTEDGFDDDQIARIFEHVPVATHNQRGLGTLWVGCPERCDREIHGSNLLRIVEESMSSEIFELMKRPDEHAIVERAHRRPRFVEDCVREQIRMALIEFAEFEPDTFVMARQENLETIHQHNVVAERSGLLGEMKQEALEGEHVARHVTMREWLDGHPQAPTSVQG